MKSKQGIESAQSAAYVGHTRRKWLFLGAALLFIGLNGVGCGVAIMMVHARRAQDAVLASKSQSSSSGPSGSLQSQENAYDNQASPLHDPSVFEKDPRLKRSFYGLAYTPEGSQLPSCSNSLENIIKDIQLMSQLTTRVRLYGADCNQSALVLEAIRQTKVDMTVYLANYPVFNDPNVYYRQRDLIIDALRTYGSEHVLGVTVGNEFMLNYLRQHNATNPNSAAAAPAADMMRKNIKDTRAALAGLNLPKNLPVGTAEAGSFFNKGILSEVDYGMSNVHAWFANRTINDAAKWTLDFYEKKNKAPSQALTNHPVMYIAEAGWPTGSSDIPSASNGQSDASEANLQIFLDTFLCQANKDGVGYFFFEFLDEKWKDIQFGGVEGWWGLLNKDRTLKKIVIPDWCVNLA